MKAWPAGKENDQIERKGGESGNEILSSTWKIFVDEKYSV